MSKRLQGKVAIVTGAGSGMGAAMVERFCAEGARVIAADISGKQQQVARAIGADCIAIHADVSNGTDVKAMCSLAISTFGRLDILCNNAGIQGAIAATADQTEEAFDQVIAINLRSVFLGMKYAIPHMLKVGKGSIINTSSMAAIAAFPTLPGYTAAKGGVSALTRVTAAEYAAKGIRVNAILPGAIDTGMTQALPHQFLKSAVDATLMGRIGEPREIADTALFLASDESSFITGALIPVDGGYTIV
jgi:NAD(P)-dependent dehydrogenase (short-subunit alcohol dehydrogenase family)